MRKVEFLKPASQRRAERILVLLQERPRSAAELGRLTHVSRQWIRPYLNRLREQKKVYVHAWVSEEIAGMKAYLREVWAVGEHEDAPRPRTLTDAEYSKRLRARRNEVDPLGGTMESRGRRAKARKPKRDVAASWF